MLTLLFATTALAGAPADGPRLRATVFNEMTAMPFTRLVAPPLHPGVTLGVTAWQHQGKILDNRLYVDVSAWHHALFEDAVAIEPEWQTTLWPASWLGLSAGFGLGYAQALYPGPTYGQAADGTWERQVDLGQPQVTASLALGVEVPVAARWSVVSQYRGAIDYPGSLDGAFPFVPHVMLNVGVEHRL